jgi:Glycosyltransferase family 87
MAHAPAHRPGSFERPATWTLVALVAIRLAVVCVIAIRAGAIGGVDADIGRAFRIATSPAIPYRGFPVEFMPLQTAFDRLLAGGTLTAATIRIAVVAFAADLAAAGALWWGWGRRRMATYLLVGLPLLSFLYLRFDLVSVALAAWSLAALRRRREEASGALLGLAVMAKLWPLVLAVPFAIRRARRALVAAAAVCLVVGAWWYLTGGAKAPFQVLSLRDTRGWHVESVVGNLLWVFHGGVPYREADAVRIGAVATWARVAFCVGLLAVQTMLWRRAARDRRDPFGAASLASVAALAAFTPALSLQWAAWLLPFIALSSDGDHDERHTAGVATVAVVLTGLIGVLWRDHAATPSGWIGWLVLVRNLVWIDIAVSWLRVPVLAREPAPPAAPPRRRAADRATEGIETVLPFDAE